MSIFEKNATFICGVPKSGTTLLLSLLDGHDELLVFPEQCSYYQFPINGIICDDDILESLFKAKKLPRLKNQEIYADVINKEKKDFSNINYSDMSRIATNFYHTNILNAHFDEIVKKPPGVIPAKAGIQKLLNLLDPSRSLSRTDAGSGDKKDRFSTIYDSINFDSSLPSKIALLGLLDGFSFATGNSTYKRWLIKQPKLEFTIERVIKDFRDVSILYIMRNPIESSLSRAIKHQKKEMFHATGRFDAEIANNGPEVNASYLEEWKRSVSAISIAQKKYPSQIMVVRYEDLTENPDAAMGAVCDFLGISWRPCLLNPTFMGIPWGGNSMQGKKFSGVQKNEKRPLPEHVRWQIESICGEKMRVAGYHQEPSCLPFSLRGLLTLLPGEKLFSALARRARMLFPQLRCSGM